MKEGYLDWTQLA